MAIFFWLAPRPALAGSYLYGGRRAEKSAILNAPKSCFDLVYSGLLHLLGAPVHGRPSVPVVRVGVGDKPGRAILSLRPPHTLRQPHTTSTTPIPFTQGGTPVMMSSQVHTPQSLCSCSCPRAGCRRNTMTRARVRGRTGASPAVRARGGELCKAEARRRKDHSIFAGRTFAIS